MSDYLPSTPEELIDIAKKTTENLLPKKSQKLYVKSYDKFINWKIDKKASSFSENVILAYFEELSKKFAPSSLWTEYSMLKSTLNIRHQINISQYYKLHAFLKRQSEGFTAKKSKTFEPSEINRFMTEAPDQLYLFSKVCI